LFEYFLFEMVQLAYPGMFKCKQRSDDRKHTLTEKSEYKSTNRKGINSPGGQFGVVGDHARVEQIHFHNIYQLAPPQHVDKQTLMRARTLLARIPLESVADIATLPEGSLMPFNPNPIFVGRSDDLKSMATVLKGDPGEAIGPVAVVTGTGGVGKTQLVSEFVHRYGQYFQGGVFWLSFADSAGIPAEIALCGGAGYLDLRPDFGNLSLKDQVCVVGAAWANPMIRLIIFDNCEDENLLNQWRPKTGGARVLVTSRRPAWDVTLVTKTLSLDVLPRSQSVDLLRKCAPGIKANDDELATIADKLGDLPLALHLGGTFLANYHRVVTPSQYLAQLHEKSLLSHPSLEGRGTKLSPTQHELHVAQTFALSYDRLDINDTVDHLARELLTRVAFFAPGEPVPRKLLWMTLGLEDDGYEVQLQAEDSLGRLVELGLLEEGTGGSLRQHRLLTAFTRGVAQNAEKAQESVENSLLEIFRQSVQTGNMSGIRQLEPHLRAVTESAMQRRDARSVQLVNTLGNYLRVSHRREEARIYLEWALATEEALYGPDAPQTSISLNDLGLVLLGLHLYDQAQHYLERAYRLFLKQEDFPNAAASLDNLGKLAALQNDAKNAQNYFVSSLDIREQYLGPEHPQTAITLSSLGTFSVTQGNLTDAHDYYQRALTIGENVFGDNSRKTAFALAELALVLEWQSDFERAAEHYKRALAIFDQVWDPDSLESLQALQGAVRTLASNGRVEEAGEYFNRFKVHLNEDATFSWDATSLSNAGLTLWVWGDYQTAQTYYEKALQLPRMAFNDSIIHNNLAIVLVPLEAYPEAHEQCLRALAIQEQIGNRKHFVLAKILNIFGVLLRNMGDLETSRAHLERALAIRKEVFGDLNRDTAVTLNNIGLLYCDEGNLPDAMKNVETALKIYQKCYGDNHPDTAQGLNDKGMLLQKMGQPAEAQKCLEQSLDIRRRTLPESHPLIAETLINLGSVAETHGHKEKAVTLYLEALEICRWRYGEDHSATCRLAECLKDHGLT
jgi:tetratricopeptide (TPR) repeat protein